MKTVALGFFAIAVLAGAMVGLLINGRYIHFAFQAALVFANAFYAVANVTLEAELRKEELPWPQ